MKTFKMIIFHNTSLSSCSSSMHNKTCQQKHKNEVMDKFKNPCTILVNLGQLNPYDFELVFLGLSLIGETFKACGR